MSGGGPRESFCIYPYQLRKTLVPPGHAVKLKPLDGIYYAHLGYEKKTPLPDLWRGALSSPRIRALRAERLFASAAEQEPRLEALASFALTAFGGGASGGALVNTPKPSSRRPVGSASTHGLRPGSVCRFPVVIPGVMSTPRRNPVEGASLHVARQGVENGAENGHFSFA